ncbi:GGDEF domain-containing protein [Chitinimonas sp.]|uniref:GGDEF domain-containing protein n=1 Tax=Chitinimonas sp. TaxID=1934313 RepID=UPI002F9387F4
MPNRDHPSLSAGYDAVPPAGAYRQQRLGTDLYLRALDGPVFYFLGWLLICLTGAYGNLALVWLPGVLFLALWVLRRRNILPEPATTPALAAWRRRQWLLIHAGCVLWSVVFWRVCELEAAQTTTLLIAVICTVAYGTAASSAFSLDDRQCLITILLLFLPAVVGLALLPGLRAIAVTLGIYLLYLLASLRRSAREYDAHIAAEYALLTSRAEVEKLTREDSLTGLANRREYELQFRQLWHRAARQQSRVAMIVLDLDHFKRVNDDYGHAVGDACLQHFAKQLRQGFRRAGDHLVRYGGEEFVVLLSDCEVAMALQLAEDFQRQLHEQPYQDDERSIVLTASMGVGGVRWAEDANPADTFSRVDRACYEAKRQGRDRIVLADSAWTPIEPNIAAAD